MRTRNPELAYYTSLNKQRSSVVVFQKQHCNYIKGFRCMIWYINHVIIIHVCYNGHVFVIVHCYRLYFVDLREDTIRLAFCTYYAILLK